MANLEDFTDTTNLTGNEKVIALSADEDTGLLIPTSSLAGVKGDKGDPGGPVGPQGERGEAGIQGEQGAEGAKGEQGDVTALEDDAVSNLIGMALDDDETAIDQPSYGAFDLSITNDDDLETRKVIFFLDNPFAGGFTNNTGSRVFFSASATLNVTSYSGSNPFGTYYLLRFPSVPTDIDINLQNTASTIASGNLASIGEKTTIHPNVVIHPGEILYLIIRVATRGSRAVGNIGLEDFKFIDEGELRKKAVPLIEELATTLDNRLKLLITALGTKIEGLRTSLTTTTSAATTNTNSIQSVLQELRQYNDHIASLTNDLSSDGLMYIENSTVGQLKAASTVPSMANYTLGAANGSTAPDNQLMFRTETKFGDELQDFIEDKTKFVFSKSIPSDDTGTIFIYNGNSLIGVSEGEVKAISYVAAVTEERSNVTEYVRKGNGQGGQNNPVQLRAGTPDGEPQNESVEYSVNLPSEAQTVTVGFRGTINGNDEGRIFFTLPFGEERSETYRLSDGTATSINIMAIYNESNTRLDFRLTNAGNNPVINNGIYYVDLTWQHSVITRAGSLARTDLTTVGNAGEKLIFGLETSGADVMLIFPEPIGLINTNRPSAGSLSVLAAMRGFEFFVVDNDATITAGVMYSLKTYDTSGEAYLGMFEVKHSTRQILQMPGAASIKHPDNASMDIDIGSSLVYLANLHGRVLPPELN